MDGRSLRLIVSELGLHAALIEPGRVAVVRLPALELAFELQLAFDDLDGIGLLPDGRLAVVADGQLVVYTDGAGWSPVAAYGRQPGAHLMATSGALVISAAGTGAMVTDLGGSMPRTRRIPIRGTVRQAAVLADGAAVFVLDEGLEVWSLGALAPARRIRVRPAGRLQLGGLTSRVWCVHAERPRWLDVLPASGTAYRVGVGEDVAAARGSADGAQVAIVRAASGLAGVITLEPDGEDPDDGTELPMAALAVEPPIEDLAWVPGTGLVLTCSRDRVLQLVAPTIRTESGPIAVPPTRSASGPIAVPPTRSASGSIAVPPTRSASGSIAVPPTLPEVPAIVDAGEPAAVADGGDRVSAHDRLLAWRQRIGAERAAAEGQPGESYDPREAPRAYDDWRRELVAAVRRRLIGNGSARLDVPAIVDAVARRLDVSGEILALAYGAHLAGIDGVPPVEIARLDGIEWREALGGGRLAALGALSWSRSRVRLARELRAIFDEQAAVRGRIAPGPIVAGRLAVIGDRDQLEAIAASLAGSGHLLVPSPSGLRWPRRLLLEATARDLTPLLPWAEVAARLDAPPARAILIVAGEAEALALGADPIEAGLPAVGHG